MVRVIKDQKKAKPVLQGAQHPRNLDPPLPACYLPAEAFLFWHLTSCGMGGGRRPSSPGGNMKKTGLFVLVLVSLLATAAWAQGGADAISGDAPQGTAPTSASFPTMRVQTPTYADLY